MFVKHISSGRKPNSERGDRGQVSVHLKCIPNCFSVIIGSFYYAPVNSIAAFFSKKLYRHASELNMSFRVPNLLMEIQNILGVGVSRNCL